jgi:hypothetical protein
MQASRGADVTLSLQQAEASVIHAVDATLGVRPERTSSGTSAETPRFMELRRICP